jgi:hypothetical protein
MKNLIYLSRKKIDNLNSLKIWRVNAELMRKINTVIEFYSKLIL